MPPFFSAYTAGSGHEPEGSRFRNDVQSLIRLLGYTCAAAVTVHLILFACVVARASILSPYSDMIDLVDNYFTTATAGRPVEYLLQPHNFHRLVGLRVLIAFDVCLFRGTGVPLVAAAAVCQAGTAFLLMKEVRRVAGALGLPLAALAVMLTYLTAFAGDVSQPVNTAYIPTTFFSLLALAAAATADGGRGDWRAWAAAIGWAVAASLSLAVALVLWPILVLMAWRATSSWKTVGVVAVSGGAFCLAYMAGQTAAAPFQAHDPKAFLKMAEYFFAYLGLPWVRGSKLLGEFLGAGLFAVSIYALFRYGRAQTNRTQRLALGMILFSLGGAVLAAAGRRDLLPEVDVPVRYAILVTPLHAGLLLLTAPAILRRYERHPRLVALGLVGALGFMVVQQAAVGIVVIRAAERTREAIALFHQGERTPEMLQLVHPDLAHAQSRFDEMQRRGVFRRSLCNADEGAEPAISGDGSQAGGPCR